MRPTTPPSAVDRRTFLQAIAALGGATLASACAGTALGSSASPSAARAGGSLAAFRDRIGLQLFTVRDRFPTDFPGTLEAVARAGYKEVQTTLSYAGLSPAQVKAALDRAGLVAPANHVNPPNGADFEKTLEGYQLIGHRYTTVNTGEGGGRGGAGGGRPPGAGGAPGAAGAAGAPAGQRPTEPPPQRAQTLDSVKRTAEALNKAGVITRKYGMKVIVHNHTQEFAPLADSSQRPYDVLIAETDPGLVALELDIGWAAVAGQNALELFRRAPGRFEVWHVKDIAGLAALEGKTQAERQRAAKIVPIGEGEIDYRAIFAQAQLAGMKHFFVEQDSAPQSGDSIAAAATSCRNLAKLFA